MKRKIFQTQEVPFAKNVRGISKIYHEILLLMKFLQTKPQVKIRILIIMICITQLLKLEMIMKL